MLTEQARPRQSALRLLDREPGVHHESRPLADPSPLSRESVDFDKLQGNGQMAITPGASMLTSALTLSVALFTVAAPPAALLAQLAEHEASLQVGLSHWVVVRTQDATVLDGDGKVLHRTHTVEQQREANGKRSILVISSTKDGADNRSEAQSAAEKREAHNRRMSSPFSAENQPKYVFTLLGPDTNNPAWVRIGLRPQTPAMDLLEGEALVDPKLGEVVDLSGHASKMPLFADRLNFQSHYESQATEGRRLSELSIDGAGGFLMFQRQFHLEITTAYEPL